MSIAVRKPKADNKPKTSYSDSLFDHRLRESDLSDGCISKDCFENYSEASCGGKEENAVACGLRMHNLNVCNEDESVDE
jgi:hypothetical protein